jgi:hypothetical protein
MLDTRQQQLQERDVRRLSPAVNPVAFMQLYISSTFPQTMSLPSSEQKQGLIPMNSEDNTLKLMKKPLSGTKYDNPGGF